MEELNKKLDAMFPMHPLPKPTDDQLEKSVAVRGNFRSLAFGLDALIPEGRHKAMALTALEEASTWAVKAVFQP